MKQMIKNSVTSSTNTNPQSEYEYRKNIYLKRKHEFETLGEDENNDVLSREEKMNIAKAEMDKVAPKSANSANVQASDDVSDWQEVASKQVLDSDGFLTDYTMYTDGEIYIFMFGDKDIYEPDRDYADWKADSEDRAWEWFNSYSGFEDEEYE